jgi:hypothetical protein
VRLTAGPVVVQPVGHCLQRLFLTKEGFMRKNVVSIRWCMFLMAGLVSATSGATCLTDVLFLDLNPGAVLRWNQIAVDASGLDHTPLSEGEVRVFGHQLGPTRSSRAMAIVHIAMFDAINASLLRRTTRP